MAGRPGGVAAPGPVPAIGAYWGRRALAVSVEPRALTTTSSSAGLDLGAGGCPPPPWYGGQDLDSSGGGGRPAVGGQAQRQDELAGQGPGRPAKPRVRPAAGPGRRRRLRCRAGRRRRAAGLRCRGPRQAQQRGLAGLRSDRRDRLEARLDGMEVLGFGPGPHAQGCRGLPVGVTVAGSAYIAEAPVERERTSVGLDVHARSVVACGIDDDTGELFRAPLVPDPEVILGWLGQLPPRWRWSTRPGRPGTGWPGSCALATFGAWWRRRARCSGPAGTGSRPTAGMRCCWPGCSGSGRSWKWRSRRWHRRRPATWCAPGRTSGAI